MRAGTGRVVVYGCLRRRPPARRPVPALSSSPFTLPTALQPPRAPSAPLPPADSVGLVEALRSVPDPRRARGRRHGLHSVLLLGLQAVITGASSWVAIQGVGKVVTKGIVNSLIAGPCRETIEKCGRTTAASSTTKRLRRCGCGRSSR